MDGIAVYKSEVKDGNLYAHVPSELATGGKHQKVLKVLQLGQDDVCSLRKNDHFESPNSILEEDLEVQHLFF